MITETERLFLRKLTKDDFSALYAVLADSDITQHYPYTFDKTRVMNWIDKSIERYNIFGFGLWAVCLKDNGEMIGDCGLTMQIIIIKLSLKSGIILEKICSIKAMPKRQALR